ncbi:MAG TPA: hypothetical protein VMR34_04105 [Candidatus Saccharimonadales bacterium]|nr:hypothetical protein [Candidatus Saccharimonadales bacterium]
MSEKPRIIFSPKTVEVTDIESGQVVHREDIASKGLSIVAQAIEAAGGKVSMPEDGLAWADELDTESE